MTATVIIIGYNPNNRLSPPPSVGTGGIIAVAACSPRCEVSSSIVVAPSSGMPLSYVYSVTYDESVEGKPAEAWVLTFGNVGEAKNWLEHVVPAKQLAGKRVLLLNPSVAEQSGQASESGKSKAQPKSAPKKPSK